MKTRNHLIASLLAACACVVACDDAQAGWFGPDEWSCQSLTVSFEISATKANGSSWDVLKGDIPPDPVGYLVVYRDGVPIEGGREGLKQRNNKYDFTAPFFRKNGITLQEKDIVKIFLEDTDDFTKNDYIGVARIVVNNSASRGSSDSGLFSATVQCNQ